jgi:putative nucleotidyltransferase with HDIG domain
MNSTINNGFYARIVTWFENYIAGFDHRDPRCRSKFDMKRQHSQTVAREIASIAQAIGLAPEDVALAKVIGLLHDVGRFLQFARYATFDDRVSVDHGVLGAAIVRENDLLAPLDPADRAVIETAILHHNKARLPELENQRCRRLAKLIRDADKLDIFRVILDSGKGSQQAEISALPGGTDVSDQVIADLCNKNLVCASHVKNQIDLIFFRIGWLLDINFGPTREMIKDRGYFAMLRSMLPETDKISTALNTVDTYLERNRQSDGAVDLT